jgi:hypothetical protein
MNLRYCGILMALGWLLLGGCVPQPTAVDPAAAVARLRTGAPLLGCREPCVGLWQQAQPQAAQLAAAGRWAELAALVESTGYQDDLSLYYLALAAERLGYPGAAASYYRQSTYLTRTSIGCQYLSRNCGGYVFPQAALVRLAAIERSLAYRPRPRRPAPTPHGEPAAPEPEAAPIAEPAASPSVSPAVEAPAPPEAAAPLPLPPPAAAPAPARPSGRTPGSEYIEPPPAIR